MLVIPTRVKVVVVMVCALALAGGLLTLTLLAKPAQAQAETIKDMYRDPFIGFVSTGCQGGEVVRMQGIQFTNTHTTIDANGVSHIQFQFNFKGQGEGLDSGDKYVFHDVSGAHVNSTGAFNETFTQNLKLIRQGSATTTDDFNATAVFHVTVNENGEVTTEFLKVEDDPCT
jgi:hypothetical protein